MKKLILFFTICLISVNSFAQTEKPKTEPKAFSTLKFYPFSLITSSLQLGTERFNEANNRSTVAVLGLRYRKNNDAYNSSSFSSGRSDWKGISLLLERRIYIPKFKIRPQIDKPEQLFGAGVYVSPFIKLDYNNNDVDYISYKSIDPNTSSQQIFQTTGKINYFGGTAGMNLGYQFTFFQYMYIDLYVGGGMRLLSKTDNTQQKVVTNSNGGNYYSNGPIETFVIKEGVVPNGGINIGVRW